MQRKNEKGREERVLPLRKDSKKKLIKGVVWSTKMEKTAVVLVKRSVQHPKYRKRYWVSKKYKAENPDNTYKEGEEVSIRESRPLSKEKRWVIVNPKPKTQKQKLQPKSKNF